MEYSVDRIENGPAGLQQCFVLGLYRSGLYSHGLTVPLSIHMPMHIGIQNNCAHLYKNADAHPYYTWLHT